MRDDDEKDMDTDEQDDLDYLRHLEDLEEKYDMDQVERFSNITTEG